jgi:hypothetical protein
VSIPIVQPVGPNKRLFYGRDPGYVDHDTCGVRAGYEENISEEVLRAEFRVA